MKKKEIVNYFAELTDKQLKLFIEKYLDFFIIGFSKNISKRKIKEILFIILKKVDNSEVEILPFIDELLPNDFWYSYYECDKIKSSDEDSLLSNKYLMILTIFFKDSNLKSYLLHKSVCSYDTYFRISCVNDNYTCDYCKSKVKIKIGDMQINDIPPFSKCNHDAELACRCRWIEDKC